MFMNSNPLVPDHCQVKLSIDDRERQLFALKMNQFSAVGQLAVLTTHGICLQQGAISKDGTYYSKDEHIPEGELKSFKRLFITDGSCRETLQDFEVYFDRNVGSSSDGRNVWLNVNSKIQNTKQGKLLQKRKFQVRAIVNIRSDGYGIILDGQTCTGTRRAELVYFNPDTGRMTLTVDKKTICL